MHGFHGSVIIYEMLHTLWFPVVVALLALMNGIPGAIWFESSPLLDFCKMLQFTWHISEYQNTKICKMVFPVLSQLISAYLSPFERRFWTFLPLGLLSLPTQWMPPGPVTRCDSRPFDDFLKVNSTASPSFRLRKPSMCNLLWKAT